MRDLILLVLVIIAVSFAHGETNSTQNYDSALSCSQEPTMTYEQAVTIAKSSDCTAEGSLDEDVHSYNPNSKTWWININADKPGCSPACVVYENGTAEINWRCTGLLQQGN